MERPRIALAALGLLLAASAAAADRPHGWQGFAERHDTDGDGAVSRQEMAATSGIFERLDADSDGTVTEADFTARREGFAISMIARRADADEDGVLARAELDAWFAERDADGDGRLEPSDREAAREARGDGPEPGRRPARAPRLGLDADGDGAVSKAEVDALFARFDGDGDGVLAAAELPEVERHGRHRFRHRRGSPGRGPGGEPGSLFERLDADGDGAVSRAEWDAARPGRR